ncbi:MAG: transcriptional repressor, partial [Leptospiraceae bacterium]|nr:transcriptional repressor [Leptospiraceae bacterium]
MVVKVQPREMLQELGLKVTRSREAVISVLQNSSNPLTHLELMEKLPKDESWDRVTVYRTLSELEEKKVLRSVSSNERITYFELVG